MGCIICSLTHDYETEEEKQSILTDISNDIAVGHSDMILEIARIRLNKLFAENEWRVSDTNRQTTDVWYFDYGDFEYGDMLIKVEERLNMEDWRRRWYFSCYVFDMRDVPLESNNEADAKAEALEMVKKIIIQNIKVMLNVKDAIIFGIKDAIIFGIKEENSDKGKSERL